ncbi:MAG: flagellar biosynthetic protein FliQ [Bryobacter sp.]|nr:flagellar biosynthetic protein FliQ [Bryobacter sp.]
MNSIDAQILDLARAAFSCGLLAALPILAVTILAGVILNAIQVVTSIQDAGFSSAPKLILAALVGILTLPWMLRQFTQLFATAIRIAAQG